MEIAKQELIVHAREAASRVLSALTDRQMSERMAVDARKREQFQRLKEQFVKHQEVGGGLQVLAGAAARGVRLSSQAVCGVCCAATPGGQAAGAGRRLQLRP